MRVLIVNDDSDVRSFLSDGIKAMGVDTIHTAETEEEALAKAIQMRYDLVTLDNEMSCVSGIDILSVIRGMMPWSVIAIVSGYTEEVLDVALDQTDIVLAKPIRVDLLQKLVDLTKDLAHKREMVRRLAGDQKQ